MDAAIRKEEKEAPSAAQICNVDGVDGVVIDDKADNDNKRKRKRRGGGENEEENELSSDAAKLESMGYRELQALAKLRGLNANGSKKDVMQRLLSTPAISVAIADGGVQDKKEAVGAAGGKVEEVLKKEKMVTDVTLDAAQLEGMGYCELQALAKARGLAANGTKKDVIERLFSTPANSATLADGGVLKKIAKGAVGEVEEEVKKERMVTATKKGAAVLDEHIPDHIKVAYHVLQVGDEIYDATMNQTNVGDNNNKFYIIQALGYNADKLPLGKLSKSTILKGYDVLKRISNVISRADRRQLEQLTGEFYTVIPHDFGFKKMREYVIDTPQKLKAKLEMVEALGEIEIATKLLEDGSSDEEDPLYARYKQLCCDFTPLEVHS